MLTRFADTDQNPAFIYPLVYMYTTATVVLANLFFGVDNFPLDARIRFGYVVFLIAISSVPVIQHFVISVSIISFFIVVVIVSGGFILLLGKISSLMASCRTP